MHSNVPLKISDLFSSVQWNHDRPELLESAISFDKARYLKVYIFNSTSHFSVKVSADSLLLAEKYLFSKITKVASCIGMEILIGQKGQKCYQYRDI